MADVIGAHVHPTAVSRAAFAEGLSGLSKSATVRYSLLRLIPGMTREDALQRVTKPGNLSTLKVPGHQVNLRMPEDELREIRKHYPEASNSFLIRYALALRDCGGDDDLARELATMPRGPRPGRERAVTP